MKWLAGSPRARNAIIGGALIAAVALGASAWVWQGGAQSGSGSGGQADREHPIVTTPRIAREDGRTVVRLDSMALQRAGIRTEKIQRAEQPDTISQRMEAFLAESPAAKAVAAAAR